MKLKHLIVLMFVFLVGCTNQSSSSTEDNTLVSLFSESLVTDNGIIDCSPGYVAIQTTDNPGIVTWQCIALPGTPGTLVQYLSAVRVDGANSNASEIQQFKQDFDENNPYVIPPN